MSISGGVHLVSSNNLNGIPVKKPALPPFFSRDLFLKSKCPLYFQTLAQKPVSLSCKAGSLNNDRRNPNFPKNDYQGPPPPKGKFKNYQDREDLLETNQILSSKNGRGTTNPSIARKSVNTMEILEVFKKYLPQKQGATENRPNATLPKRGKGERGDFDSLLNHLKSHANKRRPSNRNSTKYTINNIHKSLEYDESGRGDSNSGNIYGGSSSNSTKDTINNRAKSLEYDESDREDSDSENIVGRSDFEDEVPNVLDSEPVSVTIPRPASRFFRRSPVSVVKHEPIMPSKTHEGETHMLREEEKSVSEPLFYGSESESGAEKSEPLFYESESEPGSGKSEGPDAEEKVVNLGALKLSELREMAKSRGLKGYSKLRKVELVERLSTS